MTKLELEPKEEPLGHYICFYHGVKTPEWTNPDDIRVESILPGGNTWAASLVGDSKPLCPECKTAMSFQYAKKN